MCNKDVYDWQEGVLCDCCEQWFCRKCARVTKQEYKELETKEEEIRYCGTCTKDIFPFYEVNNILQHKILIKSGRPISNNNKDIAEIKSKIKIKKKTTLWPLFIDGVQLPQGKSHFEEAVYFLPQSSQKFLVLILSTSKGWKAESNLEPPSGFKHGTSGLGSIVTTRPLLHNNFVMSAIKRIT